jgi:hypothetical protein
MTPVIDSQDREFHGCGSLRGPEHDETDTLTGGDVLPDFSYRVADSFP